MEIDLNLAVYDETEKNACGCGDGFSLCNSTSSESSNASSSIYVELWHACAGPLTILHKNGDLVVYFPQGHLEQANFTPSEADKPFFDLPPQILCRVVDVQLIANNDNDEVYTQLSLSPLQKMEGVKLQGKEKENGCNWSSSSHSHMFCKTLTASDTSTHGGFSVPRRAAEDCFPPLNYEEQRPSQELVATDLHGVQWKFRHIYRGQPRRHLLTTGWSAFVSRKNLVSGDAVLFMRGEAGDVRLGIRRAARPRKGLPRTLIKNQLSRVAKAFSTNAIFNVVYSPRATHPNFVVPYRKYLESTASPIPVGTTFEMKYDLDDSPERRLRGVVTGVSDVDPYRWPNSKWRSLIVCWDDMVDQQERVSPWDIDSSSTYAFPSLKRPRSSLQTSPLGSGGDFVRSCKVLQGQEKVAKMMMRNGDWFPKVLQGQEMVTKMMMMSDGDWLRKALQGQEMVAPSFYPLASEGGRRLPFPPIFKGLRLPETAPMHHHLVGRAVNLSQLHGCDNLLLQLQRLFSMQRA